jgi:LysM repeat protein
MKLFKNFLLLSLLAGLLFPPAGVLEAARPAVISRRAAEVTAYDLIVAMNSLRMSNGLPALIEDPIIDSVAQSTAQTMAANQMSWHIGDVSGRLAAAGFGGGSKVWGTENFAVGNESIDEIMLVWSDASHMIPAVNAAYCNIGAGIAKSPNGMTYYILQAAYTAGKMCGEYTSSGVTTNKSGGTTSNSGASGVSQVVMPVKIATPDSDGKVFHVVQAGQSFWSIAIAYKITIKDLQSWNNLSADSNLKMGQKLFIPGSNTAGYATPTQPGGIQVNPPDAEGKITHVVQSYQTLSAIALAYGTTVDAILALNGLQADWSLQIGQKLIVRPSNNTPTPTLHPLQLLTPADDGKYYHIIQSGETLSWIAHMYNVPINDLLAWNGLNASSIILPDQKLFLQVTPPATITPTPEPPTVTPTATFTLLPPTATATNLPGSNSGEPTLAANETPIVKNDFMLWGGIIFLVAVALGVGGYLYRKKK